jgi:hypothetical protein
MYFRFNYLLNPLVIAYLIRDNWSKLVAQLINN